ICAEDLRHSNFLAKDSWTHILKSFFTAETQSRGERRGENRIHVAFSAFLSLRLGVSTVSLHLPNALISTSTPAGRSSFIRASTVCWVGSRMSSSRLCVRISNCSRDFLSTCGERKTVVILRDVGSGMGPATEAPVLFAVSTISVVD